MCNVACCSLFEADVTDFEYSCVIGLKCVAVCCSVLQCVAVVAVCDLNIVVSLDSRVLQCIAVCCSVLQCIAVCCSVLHGVPLCCSVLLWQDCVGYS